MYKYLLFFFLGVAQLSAQDSLIKKQVLPPRFTLKSDIFPLINPFKQAAAIAGDIRLSPQFCLDLDVGYYFNSTNLSSYREESFKGPRLRGAIKYLVSPKEHSSFYVGVEGKYNNVTNWRYKNLSRQGGQYAEFALVQRRTESKGLSFRLGIQAYSGKNKRVFIDYYNCFGFVRHHVTRSLPADAELLERNFLFNFERPPGRYRTPDLVIGMDFGYCFW